MSSPLRATLVAALAIACHGALAQTAVPPAITVQRIAPQLVAFAGSQANFQSLVTGLAQGTQIQLVTPLPDGSSQLVTFTPAAPLSADQIAQVLESARQQLIGLGIGAPTAEQLAAALMGGVVPTALGGSQVAGALSTQTAPSPAVQIQGNAAAGATTSTTPSVNTQLIPGAAPRFNTSDSRLPAGATSRSPVPATPLVTPAPSSAPEATSPPAPAAPPATGQTGTPRSNLLGR
jgi:hypothetical protein